MVASGSSSSLRVSSVNCHSTRCSLISLVWSWKNCARPETVVCHPLSRLPTAPHWFSRSRSARRLSVSGSASAGDAAIVSICCRACSSCSATWSALCCGAERRSRSRSVAIAFSARLGISDAAIGAGDGAAGASVWAAGGVSWASATGARVKQAQTASSSAGRRRRGDAETADKVIKARCSRFGVERSLVSLSSTGK
jgi:hypothetical protein